jgi:hypothetical protein
MLSQRAALAIVLAPFAIAMLEWSQREAPSVPCGGPSTGQEDWLAGLAPAAFATGCICLWVAIRVSAHRRGGRAGVPTLAASAGWLVAAMAWWIEGEASPVSLYALLAYVLLLAAVPAAVTLIAAILIRPSWPIVAGLAWLCAVVLVPGLVAVVDNWGVDFVC